MASQILAGLDGIERSLAAPAPVERPYDSDAEKLPSSLEHAIGLFRQSSFFRKTLGDAYVDYYSHIKQAEWDRYAQAVSEWEEREYFSLF